MVGSFCSKTCVRQRSAISASESIIRSTLCRARSSTEVLKRKGKRAIRLFWSRPFAERTDDRINHRRIISSSAAVFFSYSHFGQRESENDDRYIFLSNLFKQTKDTSTCHGAWSMALVTLGKKTRNLISCFLSNRDNYQGGIHLRWRSDLQHVSNNLHSYFSRLLFFGCLEETSHSNTWLVLDRFLSLLFHSCQATHRHMHTDDPH